MRKLIIAVGLRVLVLAFAVCGMSQQSYAALSTEQRLVDFQQLVSIVNRHYAPLHWKEKTINLDWKKTVKEFEAKALAAKSDAEFYQVMARLLSSLKDAHVSAQVPSTFRARLGFLCDYVAGKVLIEAVDTLRLPEELFPFKKGDQLIAIDNVPVEKIMQDISEVTNTGYELSQKRIAAAYLTSRRQSTGLTIPRGNALVTVLPKGAAKPVTVVATWMNTGLPIIDLDDLSNAINASSVSLAQSIANIGDAAANGEELLKELNKLSIFKLALPKAQLNEWISAGVNDIGSLTSMFELPEGAQAIDGLPITAAIYQAKDKKIGVIRIPGYMDDNLVAWVAQAVAVMESETDVLVLDQTNNPGGSVAMVSELTSLFAQETAKDMMFEIRSSLRWVEAFGGINQQIAGMLAANPKDAAANALQARFKYLEEEMRDSILARKFLTAPVSLNLTGSFGVIQPQPLIKYTKPILMLINEFDFSGGDAFPAIMRDNNRVVLFGNRTSGAGGNVEEYGPLANSYFKFSLTESLMVRPNGQYMENLGISPDIQYNITEEDFMGGYKNYVKAFTVEALKLVGVNTTIDELVKEEQAKKAATNK